MKDGFSIQVVSRLTGITGHTLRAWEKRYQAVTPARNDSGRRLYSQAEIDRLQLLQRLVQAGNNISSIANLPNDELEELQAKLGSVIGPSSTPASTSVDLTTVLQTLIVGLRNYKLDMIAHELEKLETNISSRDLALNVLSPLMGVVGDMCERGQINVAQEHALSSLVKFQVGAFLYRHSQSNITNNMNVILTTPEGEAHEFGILIASLLCAHYGVKFYYFGPSMPIDALVTVAKEIDSKLIILGSSKHYEQTHGQDAIAYLDELLPKLENNTEVWAGGFPVLPERMDHSQVRLISTLIMLDHELASLKIT